MVGLKPGWLPLVLLLLLPGWAWAKNSRFERPGEYGIAFAFRHHLPPSGESGQTDDMQTECSF